MFNIKVVSALAALTVVTQAVQVDAELKVVAGAPAPAPHNQSAPVTVTVTATVTQTATATVSSSWPYATDNTEQWTALGELPDDVDAYTAYMKIMASTEDAVLTWMYNGFATPVLEGFPETVGTQSQTCEIFNVTHTSNTTFRVDWDEMIIISEYQTQQPATTLYNFITGTTEEVANYYTSGAVTWFVEKNGSNVDITIAQTGAVMKKTSITAKTYGDMVILIHYEEKVYSTGYDVSTTLMPSGKLADVRNTSLTSVAAQGNYYCLFEGEVGALDTTLGFPANASGGIHLVGTIEKGDAYGRYIGNESNHLYPSIWAELQENFPTYFEEDGHVTYNYSALFGPDGPLTS